MAQYDDTNTGIIGKNDYKNAEKQPDQKGRCNVNGLWYWLSGWDKQKGDRTFTSLAFTLMTQDEVDKMNEKRQAKQQQAPQQAPQQQPQARPQAPQASANVPQQPSAPVQNQEPPMDFDDDIPF